MAELRIRFKKKPDGSGTLTCVRPDGTSTGQKSGGFFIWHDLEHYAIETTLGLDSAFYGMVARGWDMDDFGSPWPRGPFPPEAEADLALAEFTAGMLDMERTGYPECAADEFNATLRTAMENGGRTLHRPLTNGELTQIRTLYSELAARWKALPPGETLDLPFPTV